MGKKNAQTIVTDLADKFQALSQQIIEDSNINLPWVDYLSKISKTLIEFSKCDAIELQLEKEKRDTCELIRRTKRSFHFDIISCTQNREKENIYKSIAVIPIKVGHHRVGLLQLMSRKENFFIKEEMTHYENFALPLGLVLSNQRSQAALRERVKELTCLYGMARAVERHGTSLDEILESTVNLIPPAWQYPEITQGRITLDGQSYATPGFKSSPYRQTADIVVKGKKRGSIEVVYTEKKQNIDEGPFLEEERHLINNMARELALIIERKHSQLEESRLQAQLRHADRLATIGQLASGVAHELNEPLTNILGFAQLAGKCPDLPEQAGQDIEKIIKASLHAREIVKKLLIFSRQMPFRKVKTNINDLIKEGLYFLQWRCLKEGIELDYLLSEHLAEITVDPSQLKQVIVNLVVNAIQAMPEGGKLDIRTRTWGSHISIIIKDTGIGMSSEVLKQIFLPFFTTKDVGEGTGLGLSVVHGIVSSHGGSIKVDSTVGLGTTFEIRLPLKGPAE
ncbi:MAG: PAS domain-containing sensor histidine kinase [Candidatus Aminicenantes bacterium]|nr:MAG: PAS domain-containing sensor histidine kinase [Candidatus Aminicenantes bacterium]